jgi:hypothetical protein
MMALQPFVGPWPLFQFFDPIQSVGFLGRGISPSQGLYLHTEQDRINAHNTDIHALIGIRTHNLSVPASEDKSCLRLRGHCDQHMKIVLPISYYISVSSLLKFQNFTFRVKSYLCVSYDPAISKNRINQFVLVSDSQ